MKPSIRLLYVTEIFALAGAILCLTMASMAYMNTVPWSGAPPDSLTPVQIMQEIRFAVYVTGNTILIALSFLARAFRIHLEEKI